jgi:tRNA pseudouridine55 synthase
VILNIYKPKGITSFNAVSQIKRKLGVRKAGHAGTLDPLAEGVLIVLTDSDTKKQADFMEMEKEYVAEIGFGIYTETYDLEKLPQYIKGPTLDTLKSHIGPIIEDFVGKQDQEVPMYSAVSVDGQRLYRMARKGKTPAIIPIKKITIKNIELLDTSESNLHTDSGLHNIPVVKIKIICSSGTYVRSLVRDIGNVLHTEAVMLSLKRTRIGNFKVSDSKNTNTLS